MQNGPTADDRALIEQIVAGSHPDLIVIHGPHVVQPVERLFQQHCERNCKRASDEALPSSATSSRS